ncbi:YihY/virulence factor BrkB family protein [soil metagenome]
MTELDSVGTAQTVRGLPRSAWAYAARRVMHGFVRHRGIDAAAALTYYAALAIFPAALTVVAAFSLGNGRRDAAAVILDIVDEVAQASTVDAIRGPLTELFTVTNPGIAFAVGIALSLWALSSYATAFGRAVNSVYELEEGRQLWKFRGTMLLLSVFLLVMFAAVIVLLLTTPRLAAAIAASLGVGEPWITVWNAGRWPVLLALVTLLIAVLYYFTPNLRRHRMRWVSFGAVFVIVVWGAATALFALYVATVGTYDRIYGWLGGAIALLVWLYITNFVLVLGAEVDAEVVRLRQLGAGIAAESIVQLPMRDTARNHMLARQRAKDEAEGRVMREEAAGGDASRG